MNLYAELAKAVKGDLVLVYRNRSDKEKWFTITRITKTTIVIQPSWGKEVRFQKAGGCKIAQRNCPNTTSNSWKIIRWLKQGTEII